MARLPGFSTDLASLGRGGSGKIVGTSSRFFLAVWQGGDRFWRTPELGGAAAIKKHSLWICNLCSGCLLVDISDVKVYMQSCGANVTCGGMPGPQQQYTGFLILRNP